MQTLNHHLTSIEIDTLFSPKIVVVIPAYNEERFIGTVVLRAYRCAHVVVVVDDGSTDKTAEIAQAAGAMVVRHRTNQGKGVALNTGFCRARELSAEVVVTLDADGQHVPEEIATLVTPVLSGQADIVIGSRYLAQTSKVPQHRIWGHKAFNFFTSQASGVQATDSQSGFRAFSRRSLDALTFCSNGFSVESEMQFIARQHALSLVEVPITILYQDKPKRSVVRHGLMVLNGLLQLFGQYRPMLFCGVLGLSMIVAAGILGIWITELYRNSHNLAVGYALISVMLFVVGNIILSTGFILHSVRALLLNPLQASQAAA